MQGGWGWGDEDAGFDPESGVIVVRVMLPGNVVRLVCRSQGHDFTFRFHNTPEGRIKARTAMLKWRRDSRLPAFGPQEVSQVAAWLNPPF